MYTRRASWKPTNPRDPLLFPTGGPCGGFAFCCSTTPLHDVPVGARYRLTAEQAEACAQDPRLRADTPTVRLNGGLAPITRQDVIGECAFSSLFGPGVQVLTAAEIRAGSPVWHSPASPDDEWNKRLVLPGGRTVGVCTALASGDDGQPLRVPMWREQRQVRNYYALMLIHQDDATAAPDNTVDGSLSEPEVPRERPVEVEFRGLATRTAVFAQSNCATRLCSGPTSGAQEEQKQEEHDHPLPLMSMVASTSGDDHDDGERKPDYVFAVPQSQLRPLSAWY